MSMQAKSCGRLVLALIAILFLGSSGLPLGAAESAGADSVTVITAAAMIDGRSSKPQTQVAIVIRGDRIIAVKNRGDLGEYATARHIDLGSATLLPGLIDTHTHIFLQGEVPSEGGYDVQLLKQSLAFRAARAVVSSQRALEQGFTTIRDMGTEGAGYGDVGIKQAIESGYIPGPHMFVCTLAISSTGGYPLENYAPELTVPKGVQLVDGPVEARRAAREQLDKGADWIKVYMTHRSWTDRDGNLVSQPTLTVEELKAIVDETHGWGRKVACHAYNGIGLKRALDGGCDSIEHGLDITDEEIAQMIKQGTWYVPTIAAYYGDWDPPDTASGQRDRKRVALHGVSFAKALRAGVKIAFGTDVGGFPWSDPMAQEFGREVELGMTPMQAIQSATSKAAELLGMSGQIGVIAVGAHADLIGVRDDPLADVKALANVEFVMKDGKVFKDHR